MFEYIQNRAYCQSYKPSWKTLYASDNAIHRLDTNKRLAFHKGCVNAISFNETGSLLATGSDDKSVIIQDPYTLKLKTTLHGHSSNVFCVQFVHGSLDRKVISGANDSDVRLYDLDSKYCSVFEHHQKKVLSMCSNFSQPGCVLSCSADGTVRLFDVRCQYQNSKTQKFSPTSFDSDDVIPQAFGGGRSGQNVSLNKETILVNYGLKGRECLYSVDISPNGNHFIVAGGDGNVRMFDFRKLGRDGDPTAFVNIYRDVSVPYGGHECTGCNFSRDGTEIVATLLDEDIYLFDVNDNFSVKYGFDYLAKASKSRVSRVKKISLKDTSSMNVDSIRYASILNLIGNKMGISEDKMDLVDGPPPLVDGKDDDSNKRELYQEDHVNSYKKKFSGHVSQSTIKGVWFFGGDSEYIMSGSDDGDIFLWDKKTAKITRILADHENNVNTCTPHPFIPMICSSGIDSFVNIWDLSCDYPDEQEKIDREEVIVGLQSRNKSKPQRGGNTPSFFDLFSAFQSMVQGGGPMGPGVSPGMFPEGENDEEEEYSEEYDDESD